jgi:hypothetical protein
MDRTKDPSGPGEGGGKQSINSSPGSRSAFQTGILGSGPARNKNMRVRIDHESYRVGWEDGRSGESSKSHEELTRTGLDDLSYLSGYIEGEARQITGSDPKK